MRPFQKLDAWSEEHHTVWMDVLRIFLGSMLTLKGFLFIADTQSLVSLLDPRFGAQSILVAHIIAIIHLFCGFMITIGLATRASCLIQIPIVLGAILFVNNHTGGERTGELIMSIIAFILLVFFFIKGSGKFSAYYYLINSKRSRLTDESKRDYKGAREDAPLDKEANIL